MWLALLRKNCETFKSVADKTVARLVVIALARHQPGVAQLGPVRTVGQLLRLQTEAVVIPVRQTLAIRGIGQPVAAVELQRGLVGVDLHRQLFVTRYHASSPLLRRAVEHKGVIVPLGLLLLGMAQPILANQALVAQIERPLHRGDGDRQTARVGRQEVVGIDADEVVTHIADVGLPSRLK